MITSKKPPYGTTKVDPDRTKAQIDKLLRDYGADAVQWTTDYRSNIIDLKFIMEAEVQNIRRSIGIHVIPPIILRRVRRYNSKHGKYEHIQAPNLAQSMRLLYWWLKSKLEAVAYGLTTIEQEFLSQVMVALPNGTTTTVGETLEPVIAGNRLDFMAQEIRQLPKIKIEELEEQE